MARQEVDYDDNSNILDDYTFGAGIDVSSYNSSSNKYTAPHFGVVMARVINGGTVNISGTSVYFDLHMGSTSGITNTLTVLVSKGMQFYVLGNPSIVRYYPLIKT